MHGIKCVLYVVTIFSGDECSISYKHVVTKDGADVIMIFYFRLLMMLAKSWAQAWRETWRSVHALSALSDCSPAMWHVLFGASVTNLRTLV